MTGRATAIVWMATANALNFGSYELIRSATMALFTSDLFASSSSVTLATGLISPASLVLLYIHRRVFDRVGTRWALVGSSSMYVGVVLIAAAVLRSSPRITWVSQLSIVVLFVAKSVFVHLLYAQYSSFLFSVLRTFPNGVSKWSTVVAGVASVVATLSGWLVTPLVQFLDRCDTGNDSMTDLLLIASVVQAITIVVSDQAHRTAQRNRFGLQASVKAATPPTTTNAHDKQTMGVFQRARLLFQDAPVLEALCFEVLMCQAASALLNYSFVSYTKEALPSNEDRALFTGSAYARINLGSGALQFFVLPLILPRMGDSRCNLWLVMPVIILVPALWMALSTTNESHDTSMFTVTSATFCVIKTLEYSIRSPLAETVYETLDDTNASFGKEVVALFANRLGKSATALLLAGLAASFSQFTSIASKLLVCFCGAWFLAANRIRRLLRASKLKAK